MKRYTAPLALLALFHFSMDLPAAGADPSRANPPLAEERPSSSTRTYQTETRYSRKCGIYSGVCGMTRPAAVGSYCVCITPSGPIHGVVVP